MYLCKWKTISLQAIVYHTMLTKVLCHFLWSPPVIQRGTFKRLQPIRGIFLLPFIENRRCTVLQPRGRHSLGHCYPKILELCDDSLASPSSSAESVIKEFLDEWCKPLQPCRSRLSRSSPSPHSLVNRSCNNCLRSQITWILLKRP